MGIDINNFTKTELIELHRLIIDRIKYLSAKENLDNLSKFKCGDIVQIQNVDAFTDGVVIKTNIKTLLICLTNGETWRVSPNVVKKNTSPSKKLLRFRDNLSNPKILFSSTFKSATDQSLKKNKKT